MKKFDCWPPPKWTEVIITWNDLMSRNQSGIVNKMLDWLYDHPGDGYHLHGYKSTEGFAFRFKNPQDAVIFALRWS